MSLPFTKTARSTVLHHNPKPVSNKVKSEVLGILQGVGISAHDVEGILDVEDVKESEILMPVNNHLSKLKSDFLEEECTLKFPHDLN